MKRFLRKTIGGVSVLICICAVIVVIIAGVCLLLHIRPAVVVSGSMEPVIHTGSMVFVDTQYDADKVVTRDIIAFDANGTMVTHRVKEKLKDGFITKGDANETQDPAMVSVDSYIGRVIIWVPRIGYVMAFLSGMQGKILVIAVFVSAMLIYFWLGREETDDTGENTGGADNSAA